MIWISSLSVDINDMSPFFFEKSLDQSLGIKPKRRKSRADPLKITMYVFKCACTYRKWWLLWVLLSLSYMICFFNASKAIVNHPQFYQFYGWYSINHQSTWVVYDIALLTRYPILSCHCFFFLDPNGLHYPIDGHGG